VSSRVRPSRRRQLGRPSPHQLDRRNQHLHHAHPATVSGSHGNPIRKNRAPIGARFFCRTVSDYVDHYIPTAQRIPALISFPPRSL